MKIKITKSHGNYDTSPEHYFLSESDGLLKAVEIAISLGKPLLLSGEPGTGKTQLANYVAYVLNKQEPKKFVKKPFVFNTKSSSEAKDLFYFYDAIGHFHDKEKKAEEFISLNAMGNAITLSHGTSDASLNKIGINGIDVFKTDDEKAKSCVVLIDEIDKAPRDFPNDLLNEIENNEFEIKEIAKKIQKNTENDTQILVIMTSNFEKNLPDAFLRRCIFYHINFPDTETLAQILSSRLSPFLKEQKSNIPESDFKQIFKKLTDYFSTTLRSKSHNKNPATSELLDWAKVLVSESFLSKDLDFNNLSEKQKTILKHSANVLFKTKEDLERYSNSL